MSTEEPFVLHAVAQPEDFPETLGTGEHVVQRDHLSLSHFEPLIGDGIMVAGSNATKPLELVEAVEKPRSRYPGQQRMPFSLVLRGPLDMILEGHHYDLVHPDLGKIPFLLFTRTLVYPDQPPGAYYEVVFN